MRDNWMDMYRRQRRHWWHEAPTYTIQEPIEVHNALCLHLIGEVTEVLSCMPWKLHRKNRASSRRHLLEELIDVQKFLMCLMVHHGFTAEDVVEMFHIKSSIVEKRAQRERKRDARNYRASKTCK